MSYKKQLEQVKDGLSKAWEALNIQALKARVLELEADMLDPDFWKNQEKAKTHSQEMSELKSEVEGWERIKSDLAELFSVSELAESEKDHEMFAQLDIDAAELLQRFKSLEFSMLFSEEYDSSNAVVSIHAGAGGTDAMDWAEMVFRMYARFCESKGWKLEVLHDSRGEEAGLKHITFSVKGRFAYGHFRSEAGVHRLVRISPFDAEKMRHTSFALFEVIPELDKITEKKIDLNMNDIRIDTFLASGHGGQSVNTTYSAIRVTHIPTGIVVSCQNERSQLQNKETALRVLKSRLFKRMKEEQAEKIDEIKGGHKSPEWGNQIRSYILHPYKMVKDHRTNVETQNVEAVLDGDIMLFIEAYLRLVASKEN